MGFIERFEDPSDVIVRCTETSLKPPHIPFNELSELSNTNSTLARPAAALDPDPLKITSFDCPLLNSETLDSPSTHLTASTMLDFPQPLGPTIPVRPLDNFISAESTKDLKPESLIFVNSTSLFIT